MCAVELLNVFVLLSADGATDRWEDQIVQIILLKKPVLKTFGGEARNFNVRVVIEFVESAIEVKSER